ncbi:MAG: hypothetical protein HOU81_15365 [Hamadaea sp.]|uniref:hypothetical protein n=1 Tax=Hamadaea sp. TaxID=2024425 RepID=UPI0018493046|nr:hypothetical protein [Hamadaea sp.]NUR72191.1 hypothetical protein [Hamadaea sp.]NUT18608.1 hypothetical protein [Hamadaea sp.]
MAVQTRPHAVVDFGVVPELVFEALTDPGRVARWLPAPLRLDEDGPGLLRVRLHTTDADGTGDPGLRHQRVLPVATDSGDAWYANLVITPLPDARSRVDLAVLGDCAREQLDDLVGRAVAAVRDDIAESFTPG